MISAVDDVRGSHLLREGPRQVICTHAKLRAGNVRQQHSLLQRPPIIVSACSTGRNMQGRQDHAHR